MGGSLAHKLRELTFQDYMSDLQIFNFNSNKVRIQTIEGREYFCAKDVCDTLGYVNGKDAISRHCKKDGVVKYALIDSLNREQKYSFINESNLYRLIIHSKLPEAEKFEEWVFNEVLPQIRKTGQYGVPQQLSRLEILQIALENEQKVIALENTVKEKEEYIAMVEEAQASYVQAKQKAEAFSEENESLLEMAETLSTKLSVASTLRIAGLSITPIKEKKGKQEPEDKASRVDRLKINFAVQASDLTEPEDKEIVIRIASPSGVILTKDNNRLQDKDELASIRETITYDGTEKGVTYYFDQEADYEKGVYKVEVLNNDKLLDRKAFSLR